MSYSLEIANPRDPLIRDPLIHDLLNTDALLMFNRVITALLMFLKVITVSYYIVITTIQHTLFL